MNLGGWTQFLYGIDAEIVGLFHAIDKDHLLTVAEHSIITIIR
jgi:hypothetical protein